MKKKKEFSEKKKDLNWRLIISFICLSLAMIYFCGYFVGKKEVANIKKESYAMLEMVENRNAEEKYIERVNQEGKIIRNLKDYREYLIVENWGKEDSSIITNKIDQLIEDWIKEAKLEEFKLFEVPEVDKKKFKASADSYLNDTYLPQIEKLIKKYKNSYSINNQLLEKLEELEEYDGKIELSLTYSKIYDLKDECSYNLELFDSVK